MTLAPPLSRLVALPWDRERYVARMIGIVDRYQTMLGAVWAGGPKEGRRKKVELLFAHPSAWAELEGLDDAQLRLRAEHARAELENLRSGEPLPAPLHRSDRTHMLALADFEWLARQLRLLARRAARTSPAEAVALYPKLSKDPVEGVDEAFVGALLALPRGRRFRTLREVVAARHGCPDFEAFLRPAPKGPTEVEARTNIGRFDALKEGRAKRVDLGGRTIAVFKHRGEPWAIEDTCPHRGGPLGKGEIDGDCVRCPLHGWPFDLRTGKMRGNENVSVRTFETGVDDDGTLWVGFEKK